MVQASPEAGGSRYKLAPLYIDLDPPFTLEALALSFERSECLQGVGQEAMLVVEKGRWRGIR